VEKETQKSQLRKFKMKGGGGTELTPAIHYVIDPANGIAKYPTVILTDGYCDHFDFKGSTGDFLILTTEQLVNHNGGSRVKQIKIEQ
jgi:predicted metal-dependent peptidase